MLIGRLDRELQKKEKALAVYTSQLSGARDMTAALFLQIKKV